MNLVPEEKAFIWKTKNGTIKIQTLQELLGILIDIPEEEIPSIMIYNITNKKENITQWLEGYFPNHQELIARFKNKDRLSFSQLQEDLIDFLQEEIYMK